MTGGLQGTRWIASVQIVVFHMYSSELANIGLGWLAPWLATWTQYFFFLSAFVLVSSELQRIDAKVPSTSTLDYFRRRWLGAYRPYALSLALTLAGASGTRQHCLLAWAFLPAHLFLVQSWLPFCALTPEGNVLATPWLWNGEAWFLSSLSLMWLAVPSLARYFYGMRRALSWCVVLGCWLFSAVPHWVGREDRAALALGCAGDEGRVCRFYVMALLRATPLGYAHVFLAGAALAQATGAFGVRGAREGSEEEPESSDAYTDASEDFYDASEGLGLAWRSWGCASGYGAFVLAILLFRRSFAQYYYFWHNGGLIPVFVLIICGAVEESDRLSSILARIRFLGDISYYQYLLQHVVYWAMVNALGSWEAARFAYPPTLLLASAAAHRLV